MTSDEHRDRVKEILLEAHRCASMGLDRMVLKLTRKRKPRNWDRVRVLPGAWGRIVGSERGAYFVDVKVADVVRALEAVMLASEARE